MAAPGLYAAEDETLDRLSCYARAGGHLIVGVRTGYADDQARVRPEVAPGRLREAAGVSYAEYSNLGRDVTVRAAAGSRLELPAGARAAGWADGLKPAGAEPLAVYEHPHLRQWPAVTTHAFGQGRVTYVGTVPNRVLAAALFRWADNGAADRLWPGRPGPVTVTTARRPDGSRLAFVHNWSWEPVTLPVPSLMQDILAGARLGQGETLTLAPWDVAVLALASR